MYSSIEVPPHLIRKDDGTLPDNVEEERERVIREKKKQYEGLDASEWKERRQVLKEEIEENEYALRRLENTIEAYTLALNTAWRRAERHGKDSPSAKTLSGNQSEDGWTIKYRAEWPESESEWVEPEWVEKGGGRIPHKVKWDPSDARLEKKGIRPDGLPQRVHRLDYDVEETWEDILIDIEEHLDQEELYRKQFAWDLSETEFCRSVIEEKLSELALGKDESDEREDLPADFFEKHPKLRKQAEAVVEIWKDDKRTIDEKMGKLKARLEGMQRIQRSGENVVKALQNRLREKDINEEYEHRNAQSFCKLISSLLRLDATR